MKDIAKDLGVSLITISKVLRNHPDIGEETRERVLARVKELDYRPNLAARSLVTGRSYLVGLVVPDLLHPFFAEVAKSLSEVLRQSGYYLIVSSSDEDPELEEVEINHLLARRLDTLIIASCRTTVDVFFHIEKQNIPYVLIDRCLPGLSTNFVGVDDELVGMLATKHLVDIGCKRIAHICGPEISPGIRRMEGYKRALSQAGMKVMDDYVITQRKGDVGTKQSGAEAMRQLLSLEPRPDGLFCFNDPLAMGAMNYALDHGVRIPEDLAIVGCGNLHYDDSLRVPLSSIDQHSRKIGEEAARIALRILNSKAPLKPESLVMQPELIVRESTQRRAGKDISKKGRTSAKRSHRR
ncbi:MAG TPA: LacI family DNA-binding transcriptional regulator [Candidatus Sulfotelmatobacter sp.]|nr:LacI family DNA-binding transcriptional regulator [Candidatus Sulfotelmatobacter sp.]